MGSRIRGGRALVSAAAIGVGALLMLAVFYRVEWTGGPALVPRFDLGSFARGLPAHARWLVPYALAIATLPALRSLVWRATAPPPSPLLGDAYHATAMGSLVNNVVPGKLGPAAAAWLLARFTGRPFGAALSSQLLAKLLELAMVVAIGAIAGAARGGGAAGRVALAGAALVAVLAAATAALARMGPTAAARLAPRRPRLAAFVGTAAEGLRAVGRPARLGAALAIAALPPLAATAAYALPLAAFGVSSPIRGGAVLLAVITFGQLTPGLPVGTGVYYAMAAYAARQLGASAADAAALAVLTHAATVLTLIAVGAASAAIRRGALRELLHRRRELVRAPPSPPRAERGGDGPAGRRSRSPT